MATKHYNFNRDVAISMKTEEQIRQFLCQKCDMEFIGMSNELPNVKLSDFDIRVKSKNGVTLDIEIKEDFTCKKTGNVGLEYECRGRSSGIDVSKSDLYLYKLHTPSNGIVLYVIETAVLRDMITNKKYFRTVVGGDVGSNSKNFLFKLDVFTTHAKKIGTLES